MDNKLIDIIIPAYNAHSTIMKTLSSIACQTMSDKCKITIVNDAGENYREIVNYFSKQLDIEEIGYSINGGPGVARQYGIDNTNCPFIMFADADDTLNGSVAIELFLGTMKKYPKCKLVISDFVEQFYRAGETEVVIQPYTKNMIWVFGKLYSREFIQKNNIRFNNTRSNEDVGFNMLFELCLPNIDEEEVVYLPERLYCWQYNKNSITRLNNAEYTYNGNMPGYVENCIYAIRLAEKINPFNEKINDKKVDIMTNLYFLYTHISTMSEEHKKQNAKACVRYYNEIFKEISDKFKEGELKAKFIKSCDEKISMLLGVYPEMTFSQFYTAIRSAPYEPENN